MKYLITALRLKEAMLEADMTQQELADRCNINKASISQYVNGSHEPGNKSAYLIAQVLKVNPAWLMGLDAPKYLQDQEMQKAQDLYEKYLNAIPEIQAAVDSLLNPKSGS